MSNKSLFEKWSEKYKRSINCKRPRGFSQRAYCQGKKKKLGMRLKSFESWVVSDHKYKNSKNISEKLLLKDWQLYRKLVADAYNIAPTFDENAVKHWEELNRSNYILFKRLLSKTQIILITQEDTQVGTTLELSGKPFVIQKIEGEPYNSQKEMKEHWEKTGSIMISIDYSNHPIFSVPDNVIFRCVHDFIVHILGDHPFGDKGEIASYNNHAKLAPPDALPALFTEVVGQACFSVEYGFFPEQKITILEGFDYNEVGKVEGYKIVDKELKNIIT
jgi:hypothetical protein